jgi:hypothetical protein
MKHAIHHNERLETINILFDLRYRLPPGAGSRNDVCGIQFLERFQCRSGDGFEKPFSPAIKYGATPCCHRGALQAHKPGKQVNILWAFGKKEAFYCLNGIFAPG